MKKIDNKGMSLVELIVSFAIVTVAVVYFSQSLVSISRIYKNARKETDEFVEENYAIRALEAYHKDHFSGGNGYLSIGINNLTKSELTTISNKHTYNDAGGLEGVLVDKDEQFDSYEKYMEKLKVYAYSNIEYKKNPGQTYYTLSSDSLHTFTFSDCFNGWKNLFQTNMTSASIILDEIDKQELRIPRFPSMVFFKNGGSNPLNLFFSESGESYDYIYSKDVSNASNTGKDTYGKEYNDVLIFKMYNSGGGSSYSYGSRFNEFFKEGHVVAPKLLYYTEKYLNNKSIDSFQINFWRSNAYAPEDSNCKYLCIRSHEQYQYSHIVNSTTFNTSEGFVNYRNNCINTVNEVKDKAGAIKVTDKDIYTLDYWILLNTNIGQNVFTEKFALESIPGRAGLNTSVNIFYNPFKKLILYVGFINGKEYRYYTYFDHNDYVVRYYSISTLKGDIRAYSNFRIITGHW